MALYEKDRTAARPKVVEGVTFHCYRTGILQYTWRSENDRIAVGDYSHRSTYWAVVDGVGLGKRFRSQEGAMRAAIKACKP